MLPVSLVALALAAAGGPADARPPALPSSAAPVQEDEAADPDAPPEGWTGAASAGVTWSSGTSETTTVAALFDATRRGDHHRWTLGAFWNYGEETETLDDDPAGITQRELGGKVQYDRFLDGEGFYVYGNASGRHDDLADLRLRATVGTGVGYQITEDATKALSVEGGLSWVSEDFQSDGEDADTYLSARGAYDARWQATETATFQHAGEALESLEDADDWIVRFDTRLKVTLTEAMFLQLQHVLDYDNTPADMAEKAENKLILTVGWSF